MPDSDLIMTKPKCTLRVGITGHRPNKLETGDADAVESAIQSVLGHLKRSTNNCRAEYAEFFSRETPELRLVTMLAEGADTIAAASAVNLGYRLNVILPFPRAIYAEKQEFQRNSGAQEKFDELIGARATKSVLELSDGASPAEDDNDWYLTAGLRMLAFSDIIIAVWNGEPEAGKGGTAHIVREAVSQGMLVIWIDLNGNACLIEDREALENRDQSNTFPATTLTALTQEFHDKIIHRIAPPDLDRKARKRLLRFMEEPTPKHRSWSAYKLMDSFIRSERRILDIALNFLPFVVGQRAKELRVDYSVDSDTQEAWQRYHAHACDIGQAEFGNDLSDILENRWRHADAVSLHCSHSYRSTYVLNFVLAALAVVFGLVSVFWWNHDNSIQIKLVLVGLEVCMIFSIVRLTRSGSEGKNDWHVRWLESRAFAELMRSGRTLALLGETASPPAGKVSPEGSYAWIEWLTRSTLREIHPPFGQLNEGSLKSAISSAIEDELEGQVSYNHSASEKYAKLDHFLHHTGEKLFALTGAIGLIFVVLAIVYTWPGHFGPFDLEKSKLDFIKALVTVLGAGLPACGAALFGIKATGDFKVAAEQASRTLDKLRSLKVELESEHQSPRLDSTIRLLNRLTSTLTTDLREWGNVYELRELTLPG